MTIRNAGGGEAPVPVKSLLLRGLYPATLTPFNEDYSLDLPALRVHLDTVAGTAGVQGLVVSGGIGELMQLSLDEQITIVQEARRVLRPGQIVVTGLSAPNARQAVAQATALKAAGADALLMFPPFDNRAYRRLTTHTPSVVQYFSEVARAGVPMVIFQYGPESGCAYSVETFLALAQIPEVVAVKATSGSLEAYQPYWDALQDRLSIMAAVDGPPLYDMLSYGAHGALIGISSVGTCNWVDLVEATRSGNDARAREIFTRHCAPLMARLWENHKPTRLSSTVSAAKEAWVQLGKMPSSRVRAPIIAVDDKVRAEIRLGLIEAGLLAPQSAAA